MKLTLKVTKESYTESKTENIDKEIYLRKLIDEENGFELILKSDKPIEEFKQGDSVEVELTNQQKRL